MNATQQAKSAYGTKNSSLRTPRGVEYEVFAQVTSQLDFYSDKDETHFPQLVHALHQNRKLWTMLASDVTDKDNGLPAQVRAQIFYLSEFTNQHTRKVLSGEVKVKALTEVNLAIMRGLSYQESSL